MTEAEILKKFAQLRKRQDKVAKDIRIFRQEIQGSCGHTTKEKHSEQHDDGYGVWYTTYFYWCPVCLEKVGYV